MAEIVGSLFGITPDLYERQLRAQDEERAIKMANLAPGARGAAMIQSGAGTLSRGIGGLMGVQDPQMQQISQQAQLLRSIDMTDPKSIIQGAQLATQMGNAQLATGLIDRAKSLQESSTKIALQQAQTLKALQPAKLTGDERYIADLRTIEQKLQNGEQPTLTEISNANIAGQMISKPRSFFDQASGQTVTIPATDPSKAFPLAYKAMAETASGTPKPSVQQATEGNLPAGSVKEIADIDANIVKLQNSKPELQSFLSSLKSGDVKYNATSNTLDLLGATVLPAFGLPETGSQVKKDEIKRALTERVNSLLLMAKGTQTEGDAARAADQIASSTTYLSQARMTGAIEGLIKAEDKLNSELGAKKTALQTQGRTSTPNESSTPKPSAPKPMAKPTELTREQKIQLFIDHNGGKPTRQQAEDALRQAGKL